MKATVYIWRTQNILIKLEIWPVSGYRVAQIYKLVQLYKLENNQKSHIPSPHNYVYKKTATLSTYLGLRYDCFKRRRLEADVFCDLEKSSGVVSIRIGPDTKFSRDTIADAESNDTTSKLFSTSMILSIFCCTCIFVADQIVPAAGGGEH